MCKLLDWLQKDGVCTEEELVREVNKFNSELSFHLSNVDTHIPKVITSALTTVCWLPCFDFISGTVIPRENLYGTYACLNIQLNNKHKYMDNWTDYYQNNTYSYVRLQYHIFLQFCAVLVYVTNQRTNFFMQKLLLCMKFCLKTSISIISILLRMPL